MLKHIQFIIIIIIIIIIVIIIIHRVLKAECKNSTQMCIWDLETWTSSWQFFVAWLKWQSFLHTVHTFHKKVKTNGDPC
jgi:hypothetical protein